MAEITLASQSNAKRTTTEPKNELAEGMPGELAGKEFSEEERKRIEEIKNGIDFMDTQSTVQYGVGAQRQLTEYTDSILSNVKSKDGGEVGIFYLSL